MAKTIVKDFTKGRISTQMLRFSVPFMLSNALQVLYSIVDMIIVGNKLGSVGLSAVSTSSHVVNFMTMLCLGFSTGGQVHISQLVGAGRRDKLNRAIGTLFTMVAAIGAAMTVIGITLSRPIIDAMNTPTESAEMAVSYLVICSAGVLFTYGYNMVTAVLRGMGNSKQPCIFIAVAAVTNLVLDLLFVLKFNWGVAGAALATVIGQGVSLAASVVFLMRHKKEFGFDFKPKSFIPDKEEAKNLAILGVPFSLRSAAVNISMIFVSSLVNTVGLGASAVFGVGIKVDDVVRKTTMAINYSVSTMVGQNIAAGEIERTKKTVYWGWAFSFLFYAIFSVIYLSDIESLFRIFTSDPEVLGLAPVFVGAIMWSFPAMAAMRASNGFIQGIGNSSLSLVFSLIDGLILRIGLSCLFGIVLDMGLYGFFLGYGLATYGTAIPGALYFFFGRWKNRKLRI